MNKDLIIAFDGDDTLWDNQIYYDAAEKAAQDLLAPWLDADAFAKAMLEIETRRVKKVGFGSQSFSLSLIELAATCAPSENMGDLVLKLIKLGEDVADAPYTPLPHARDAVRAAKQFGKVILITKGNSFEQTQKLNRNGMGVDFDAIEIVPDKTTNIYQDVAQKHDFDLSDMIMVGNSLKSDIKPLIGHARALFHVPFHTTWQFERDSLNNDEAQLVTSLRSIKDLVPYLEAQANTK